MTDFNTALHAAREQYPQLDATGFYEGRDERRAFTNAEAEEAFPLCLRILDRLKFVKHTTRKSPTSYGLKHDAEHLSDRDGKHVYVPNGVMIVAMIHRGVPIERWSCNAVAAVSLLAYRALRRDLYNQPNLY